MELTVLLGHYVRQHHLGRVLAETGFILAEAPPTVRAPDIAFLAAARIPPEGLPPRFFPGAPDLAVEVVSPSNTVAEIQGKVTDYLAAGARLVWVVEPRTRTVMVYRSEREISILREGEELDGGEVVPGFRVRVGELFEG